MSSYEMKIAEAQNILDALLLWVMRLLTPGQG